MIICMPTSTRPQRGYGTALVFRPNAPVTATIARTSIAPPMTQQREGCLYKSLRFAVHRSLELLDDLPRWCARATQSPQGTWAYGASTHLNTACGMPDFYGRPSKVRPFATQGATGNIGNKVNREHG